MASDGLEKASQSCASLRRPLPSLALSDCDLQPIGSPRPAPAHSATANQREPEGQLGGVSPRECAGQVHGQAVLSPSSACAPLPG